jgi:hypothetical protein
VRSHSDHSPRGLGPADCATHSMQESSHCHFHCARGICIPCTRTYVKLLGPCFKTGKRKPFCQGWINSTAPQAASSRFNPAWQTRITAPHTASRGGSMTLLDTGFLCFRFSNFRYSLTLFSKSFASFPHGTCALSVSHLYLAFDGIYHLLRAAIPNNSTL